MNSGLVGIIERIYETASTSDWTGVLADLARVAGLDAIGLTTGSNLRSQRPPEAHGIAQEYRRTYNEYHLTDRVWAGALCTNAVGTVGDVLPPRTLHQTKVYQEWIRPQGWHRVRHARLWTDARARAGLLMGEHRGAAPYLTVIRDTAAHLGRALEIRREFDCTRAISAMSFGVLDAMPVAIVLVDHATQALFVNRHAEKLLFRSVGARIASGRLRLGSAAAQMRLEKACARAENTLISVPCPGRHALQLMVASIEGIGGAASGSSVMAVVIGDREEAMIVDQSIIAKFYGLTPAQAKLVALLVQGHSLDDAATALRLTIGTVRDRMKRVLARTGTRRQADLVRLVLSGPAVLDWRASGRAREYPLDVHSLWSMTLADS